MPVSWLDHPVIKKKFAHLLNSSEAKGKVNKKKAPLIGVIRQ